MQEWPAESAPKLQGRLNTLRTFLGGKEEPEHRQQVRAGWGLLSQAAHAMPRPQAPTCCPHPVVPAQAKPSATLEGSRGGVMGQLLEMQPRPRPLGAPFAVHPLPP